MTNATLTIESFCEAEPLSHLGLVRAPLIPVKAHEDGRVLFLVGQGHSIAVCQYRRITHAETKPSHTSAIARAAILMVVVSAATIAGFWIFSLINLIASSL